MSRHLHSATPDTTTVAAPASADDRPLQGSDRFGFDAPRSQPIEQSIAWAARHGFRYIDFQADLPPNDIASFDAARVREVRALCERHRVALGIHPSSAINNAEYVPIMAAAVDDYLAANLDLAVRLGCGWIVGHGGYQFGDLGARRSAAIARIKRLLDAAERSNMSPCSSRITTASPSTPRCTICRTRSRRRAGSSMPIDSPHFKWAFNVAHGNLVADGWDGFLAAFGAGNIGQVRLNDNRGDYEVHLVPGDGQHRLCGAVRARCARPATRAGSISGSATRPTRSGSRNGLPTCSDEHRKEENEHGVWQRRLPLRSGRGVGAASRGMELGLDTRGGLRFAGSRVRLFAQRASAGGVRPRRAVPGGVGRRRAGRCARHLHRRR